MDQMIVICALFAAFMFMAVLGTVILPKINRQSWLVRLEKKRLKIRAEIELMNQSLDSSEAFEDFERVSFDLALRSMKRGAHFKNIMDDYDAFQSSLKLYSSDLLGARIERSIAGNGNVERLLKERVVEVRERVLETLSAYMDEFEDDQVEDLLINPVDLYTRWSERMAKLDKHKEEGWLKSALDHAKTYDAHLDGLVEAARSVRTAKGKLVLVDEYMQEFYTDEATYRPVTKEKRDEAAELLMNAGWAWRLHDNARAIEMAERVTIRCDGFIGGLRTSFGELPV